MGLQRGSNGIPGWVPMGSEGGFPWGPRVGPGEPQAIGGPLAHSRNHGRALWAPVHGHQGLSSWDTDMT